MKSRYKRRRTKAQKTFGHMGGLNQEKKVKDNIKYPPKVNTDHLKKVG